MSKFNKEYCYEYFNCKELDCSRRKKLDINCWDLDNIKCETHSDHVNDIKNQFKTKLEACKLCIYYISCNE